MFDKSKREQRHAQEDATFNRMLLWLAGAVVVELFIVLVSQVYVNYLAGPVMHNVLDGFFGIFTFLGAVLTAAGIVWAVLSYRKGKPVLVPCICAAAAAGLWVMSGLGHFLFDVGMNVMMILPAVGAVLIVVYFLYQRVFFLNALLTAGGLLALWLHRQYYMNHPTMIRLFFAAAFVLLAAGLALSFLLRRDGGKLRGLRVMPPDTDYLMTWITCGVTALALVLAMALGTAAGFYLLFALVAWVFVQAVFYTVRLM